jgi:hypothetical protein
LGDGILQIISYGTCFGHWLSPLIYSWDQRHKSLKPKQIRLLGTCRNVRSINGGESHAPFRRNLWLMATQDSKLVPQFSIHKTMMGLGGMYN